MNPGARNQSKKWTLCRENNPREKDRKEVEQKWYWTCAGKSNDKIVLLRNWLSWTLWKNFDYDLNGNLVLKSWNNFTVKDKKNFGWKCWKNLDGVSNIWATSSQVKTLVVDTEVHWLLNTYFGVPFPEQFIFYEIIDNFYLANLGSLF